MRAGIHAGPIFAGIVGQSRYAYDVWGDTVNTASRLESTSEPGEIQVSSEVAERLRDAFLLERRRLIEVRGQGPDRDVVPAGSRRLTLGRAR